MANKQLTGYPSIDKPWLDKYPEYLCANRKSYESIYENLRCIWNNEEEIMINFYDTYITAKEFFDKVICVAKSLCTMGVKENDSIAVSLESVPEFLEIFLACELCGCSVKNFIEPIENGIKLIQSCTADIYITHDYVSQKDIDAIYKNTKIRNIILVEPLFSVKDKTLVRDNIKNALQERYTSERTFDERNIMWEDFLEFGKAVEVIPDVQKNNILFSAFTSGSSGKPKEVLHTSQSILGAIGQLALSPSHEKGKDTWFLTILPPTLVAVVVAMMFYPLADGKQLILDPFCRLEDLDIEMMHYEPTCWGLIPLFFNALLESTRIPDNYDMSYFKLFGFGAEPMTNKFISRVQKFLDVHYCKAPFSAGYGQSEGGSGFTVCIGREMLASGSSGMPFIDTTISIFEYGTSRELTYGEVGEICKTGPGLMVGYADKDKTEEVLKKHPDGNIWLHTGDYGYMSSEGMLFVLGRRNINVFPGKLVFSLKVENQVLEFPGIKEAILVSGKDSVNIGYDLPYLFVILENEHNDDILPELSKYLSNILLPEEVPERIYIIDKKPINHFKTDRQYLQKKYNL